MSKKTIMAEITGLEKDRARIAADLHDELGPMLSSVKMRINSLDLIDTDDQVQIKKTNQYIDDILPRMREISFDLMPNSLLRKGLVIALQELIGNLNRDTQTSFKFLCEKEYYVDEERAINIYRIIQEVIHNSIKHSQASKVEVALTNINKVLILKISDNGRGFNYEKVINESTGIGLKSIKSRTQLMGAKIFVQSLINEGTSYNFEIPLTYEPAV